MIANPAGIPLARLFERFVIDRKELAYQLKGKSSGIDARVLLDALDNEKLAVSLATLLAAPRVEADDAVAESGRGRPSMPHQAA